LFNLLSNAIIISLLFKLLNSDLRIILLLILLISVALQVRRVTTENEGSRNLL